MGCRVDDDDDDTADDHDDDGCLSQAALRRRQYPDMAAERRLRVMATTEPWTDNRPWRRKKKTYTKPKKIKHKQEEIDGLMVSRVEAVERLRALHRAVRLPKPSDLPKCMEIAWVLQIPWPFWQTHARARGSPRGCGEHAGVGRSAPH